MPSHHVSPLVIYSQEGLLLLFFCFVLFFVNMKSWIEREMLRALGFQGVCLAQSWFFHPSAGDAPGYVIVQVTLYKGWDFGVVSLCLLPCSEQKWKRQKSNRKSIQWPEVTSRHQGWWCEKGSAWERSWSVCWPSHDGMTASWADS